MSTTTPAWATGSAAYRVYLVASGRCEQAFRPAVRPRFHAWTHPATGERRHYITNVAEILHFTYEGQGAKVRGGVLDGEALSNTQTYKMSELIRDCRFWVDDQRRLHYTDAATSSRHHTAASIADAINATRTRR